MTSVSTLKELFLDEVKDLLNAERQLVKALPKMIRGLKKRGFIFVTMQELANAH